MCGFAIRCSALWGLAPCGWPGWWLVDFSGVLAIAPAEATRNAREIPIVRRKCIRHNLLLAGPPLAGEARSRGHANGIGWLGGSRSVSSRIVADASGEDREELPKLTRLTRRCQYPLILTCQQPFSGL